MGVYRVSSIESNREKGRYEFGADGFGDCKKGQYSRSSPEKGRPGDLPRSAEKFE